MTLLNPKFLDKYKCEKVCKRSLYREHKNWLVPALCYALRDRSVVLWQVEFWNEDVIQDAVELAKKIGLEDDEAAIVAAAAYDSSSPGWFHDVIRAAKTGRLSGNGFRWNWNDPPRGAQRDSEGLKEWRRFVLWQYYAVQVWHRRHEIRPRSIKYFDLYLAQNWILPGLDKNGRPLAKDRRNLNPVLVKPKL